MELTLIWLTLGLDDDDGVDVSHGRTCLMHWYLLVQPLCITSFFFSYIVAHLSIDLECSSGALNHGKIDAVCALCLGITIYSTLGDMDIVPDFYATLQTWGLFVNYPRKINDIRIISLSKGKKKKVLPSSDGH